MLTTTPKKNKKNNTQVHNRELEWRVQPVPGRQVCRQYYGGWQGFLLKIWIKLTEISISSIIMSIEKHKQQLWNDIHYSITLLMCISWCTWSWLTPLDKRSTRSWGCTHSKVLFCCWYVLFFCAALSPFIDEALIKKVIFRGRCVSSLFLLGQ